MSLPTRRLVFPLGAALTLSVVAVTMAGRSLAIDGQAGLVIRSTTRLVQMSVVAQDKQGRPVVDLKREDFEVFDNGKRCPISVFVVEGPAIISQPQPVPRHTFTNQYVSETGARSGYAVVLLDWLNTPSSDQYRARQQVVQMLQRIGPNDRIALYVLGRGLRTITEFGADKEDLLQKLADLRGDPSDLLEVQPASVVDASVSAPSASISNGPHCNSHLTANVAKEEQVFLLDRRVQETVRAFQEIADHLAGVPGRKILIWVSAGFPSNIDSSVVAGAGPGERTYNSEIGRVIEKLNNADVAVYPIDARGLTATPSAAFAIDTMKEFASRTGGLAWYNRNDMDVGMRTALDDVRFTYTIGFYPPEDATHRFHKVRLQVRQHDVRLRYRDGYYLDNPGESYPQNREAEVAPALLSPVDSTAISITIRADRKRDALMLRISLDARALDFVRENDRWHGKLEMGAGSAVVESRKLKSSKGSEPSRHFLFGGVDDNLIP